jgi:FlaA1/EpsC-like NDP-sugar epimerase
VGSWHRDPRARLWCGALQVPHSERAAEMLAQRVAGRYADLLPRAEHTFELPPDLVAGKRVLVTGADGFLGRRIAERLDGGGAETYLTDLEDLDITNGELVDQTMRRLRPDLVIHLAAMKHAPVGEVHPLETTRVNVVGTHNVIEAATVAGVLPGNLVFVSTCKAAAPETVYGATKLLGERITLRAGYSAVRLGNVLGSSGSVLETWVAQRENGDPLAVSPCLRYWLTPDEAVGLNLSAIFLGPGLYYLDAGVPEPVENLARRFEPGVELQEIPPRLGDRLVERFVSDGEVSVPTAISCVLRIREVWEATEKA